MNNRKHKLNTKQKEFLEDFKNLLLNNITSCLYDIFSTNQFVDFRNNYNIMVASLNTYLNEYLIVCDAKNVFHVDYSRAKYSTTISLNNVNIDWETIFAKKNVATVLEKVNLLVAFLIKLILKKFKSQIYKNSVQRSIDILNSSRKYGFDFNENYEISFWEENHLVNVIKEPNLIKTYKKFRSGMSKSDFDLCYGCFVEIANFMLKELKKSGSLINKTLINIIGRDNFNRLFEIINCFRHINDKPDSDRQAKFNQKFGAITIDKKIDNMKQVLDYLIVCYFIVQVNPSFENLINYFELEITKNKE